MIRASVIVAVSVVVAVAACKSSDDDTKTVDTENQGTTRSIACGSNTCQNDDFCCGSVGWGDAACAVSCDGKNALSCDDATDCQEGAVCCYIEASSSVTSTQCLTACPMLSDRGQLCKTGSTECPTGTTCKALSVKPGDLASCQ